MVLEETDGRVHLMGDRTEPLVVLTKHCNISIIIPGDIALVAHCAKERPAEDCVRNPVSATHAVELHEHVELQ